MQRSVRAREPQLAFAVSDQRNPLALPEESKRPARIGPFSPSGFVIVVAVVSAVWIWHSCTPSPLAIQSGHVVGNWYVPPGERSYLRPNLPEWRLRLFEDGSFTLFLQKSGASIPLGISGTFRVTSVDGAQFIVFDSTTSSIPFGSEFRVIRIDGSLALFDPDQDLVWRR